MAKQIFCALTIALSTVLVGSAQQAPATAPGPVTPTDRCAPQIDAALEGSISPTSTRPRIAALKEDLSKRAYHEAFRAGVELMGQPELNYGKGLDDIVAVLGRADLMFADVIGDARSIQLFYNTNGGPLELGFRRCALIHKGMDTPPRWRGTDAELAELWSKVRESKEWWGWGSLTPDPSVSAKGILSLVADMRGPRADSAPVEVDLEDGMSGNTGHLSFVLPDERICKGRWFSSSGNGLRATTGRLLSQYGPTYAIDALVPRVLQPNQSMGQAFVECGEGRTIRLEFLSGVGVAHGWGIATDGQANIYRFLF